jgi:hypothetical protein
MSAFPCILVPCILVPCTLVPCTLVPYTRFLALLYFTEAVRQEREISNAGGKNWILPKEMNANRFFWDSHWQET